MIPVGTNLKLKNTPLATLSLLFVNGFIFAFSSNVKYETEFWITHYLMNIPGEQYPWQLITSMFLHSDLFHILFNSLYLLVFGPFVEDKTGWKVYLFLYFLTGIAANLVHGLMAAFFMREELFIPSLGASGAITGIMGVYLYRCYYSKIKLLISFGFPTRIQIPAVIILSIWFLQDFGGGIDSIRGIYKNVAFWAHVGGFAAGFGACKYLHYEIPARKERLEFVSESTLGKYGGYGEGIEACEELLKNDPDNPRLHLDLARVKSRWRASFEGKNHYEQAIKLLFERNPERAREIFVEYWKKYLSVLDTKQQLRLSLLLSEGGQFDFSAQTLQILIDSHQPLNYYMEQAHLNLARIYKERLKRNDLALYVYQKFVERFPESEHVEFANKMIGSIQASGFEEKRKAGLSMGG